MTVEEYLKESSITFSDKYDFLKNKELIIEFAQYHVKQALEAAGEIIENELEKDFLNKDSILNVYPESNIV